jgi:hypothetical protein
VATISNLYVDQGSDFATIVYVTTVVGTPLNLTDYTVEAFMKKSYMASTSYPITAAIEDAVAGSIKLTISGAQSLLIPAGRYLYQVRVVNTVPATDLAKRVVEGLCVITPYVGPATP